MAPFSVACQFREIFIFVLHGSVLPISLLRFSAGILACRYSSPSHLVSILFDHFFNFSLVASQSRGLIAQARLPISPLTRSILHHLFHLHSFFFWFSPTLLCMLSYPLIAMHSPSRFQIPTPLVMAQYPSYAHPSPQCPSLKYPSIPSGNLRCTGCSRGLPGNSCPLWSCCLMDGTMCAHANRCRLCKIQCC